MRLTAILRFSGILLATILAGCAGGPSETPPEQRPAESATEPEPPARAPLAGSAWIAERILDKPAGMAESLLEFPEADQVSGNAGCNSFSGSVSIESQSIEFGPLATTRRMCAPAINGQETVFLEALELSVSWHKVANVLELLDANNNVIMVMIRN
jgi:heat shock protein HslJ